MFRNQLRLRRLGALGVFVVASTFAWAPSASAATQPSQAVGVIPGPIVRSDSSAPCGKFVSPDYGINEPGESLPGLQVDWRPTLQDRDPGGWLLTDDVTDDHWARPLGLRTALVGPHDDHQPAPARCDVEFRDLRTATLEILSSDPGTRGGR